MWKAGGIKIENVAGRQKILQVAIELKTDPSLEEFIHYYVS